MTCRLGVLLADLSQLRVALAVCAEPEHTQLFLMDDAVRAAGDPGVRALLDAGAEVALCAGDAQAHGVEPVDGGVRFGSQHDHAVMMREAERVISLAGARIGDHRPRSPGARTICVRLTRPANHPRTAQALRSAVGYAAGDLEVVVLVEPPARGLLAHADHAPPVVRALATLRALGHTVSSAAPGQRPPGLVPDIEVTWS